MLIKNVANVIEFILMSQNFQFMKISIVNINRKEVATFFVTKSICATPNKSLEPPLICSRDMLGRVALKTNF